MSDVLRLYPRGAEMLHDETLLITSCYDKRFWLALGPWVAHLAALGEGPIEVVSLDGKTYGGRQRGVTTFIADTKGRHLRYGVPDEFRLERILFHLGEGRACIHLDLDVRMKRKFSHLANLPYDFIISRDFGFPEFAVRTLGFAACSGFFIAKPGARLFCEMVLNCIRQNTYQSHFDQYIINTILCEAPSCGTATAYLDNAALNIDLFEVDGVRIGVLPKEAIERKSDTSIGVFGNHARPLIDQFLLEAVWEHPIGVLKELLSTSTVGKKLIRARDAIVRPGS